MKIIRFIMAVLCLVLLVGCGTDTSDSRQQEQQERILSEGTAQVGMPAITNFRERRLLKTIYELRDQDDLVTYTYLENAYPVVVKGHTALGGKLTYVGVSIGYGIPASTQFTNPEKTDFSTGTIEILPQADPNGLFSPSSADATWVMLKDPQGNVKPQYIEPKIYVSTYRLPED